MESGPLRKARSARALRERPVLQFSSRTKRCRVAAHTWSPRGSCRHCDLCIQHTGLIFTGHCPARRTPSRPPPGQAGRVRHASRATASPGGHTAAAVMHASCPRRTRTATAVPSESSLRVTVTPRLPGAGVAPLSGPRGRFRPSDAEPGSRNERAARKRSGNNNTSRELKRCSCYCLSIHQSLSHTPGP